jgi:hypothetical protein
MSPLPSTMIIHLTLPAIRRLFAKAGYNIALISRESPNLHKFAAELKTGGTDVRHPCLFSVRQPPTSY